MGVLRIVFHSILLVQAPDAAGNPEGSILRLLRNQITLASSTAMTLVWIPP